MKVIIFFNKISPLLDVSSTDNKQCVFSATVIPSDFIGKPREKSETKYHRITVSITWHLIINWHLKSEVDILKVLYERGKEYFIKNLKNYSLQENEEFVLSTSSEEDDCPFNLDCIDDPNLETQFEVDIYHSNLTQNDNVKNETIKVFISYAKEDEKYALKLYNELQSSNISPWIDKHDIFVGEKWKNAIRKAIKESDYFITLLSSNSVNKKGFVNNEIRMALDLYDEFPEDNIFILPLRLDNCKIPFEKLRQLHVIDIYTNWNNGLERIQECLLNHHNQKKLLLKNDKFITSGINISYASAKKSQDIHIYNLKVLFTNNTGIFHSNFRFEFLFPKIVPINALLDIYEIQEVIEDNMLYNMVSANYNTSIFPDQKIDLTEEKIQYEMNDNIFTQDNIHSLRFLWRLYLTNSPKLSGGIPWADMHNF